MKNGRVIINRKICDNAPECSGIEVCPTSAMHWDDELQQVAFNGTICMDCGMCAEACPVGAILWGEDDEDYLQKVKQVEEDPRSFEELSVERYGAMPIENPIESEEMNALIESCKTKYLLFELFNDDSINCLAHSIRIEDIKNLFSESVSYHKVQLTSDEDISRFGAKDLPALLIYRNRELIGSVSGYYDDSEELQSELKKQI